MKNIPQHKAPNYLLLKAIQNQEHPYGSSPILGPWGPKLAELEYQRVVEFHDQYGGAFNPPVMALHTMHLLKEIQELEAPIKEELEELAEFIVREFLGATEEDISLQGTLDVDIKPQLSDERPVDVDPEKLQEHVQKRIILNATVHGAAVHIWKSLHFLLEERLEELSPGLFGMYNRYIADSSALTWQTPPVDKATFRMALEMGSVFNVAQGQNQVDVPEEGIPEVQATASIFPTMIHELIKGILDVVILYGIDGELTEDELEWVYQQADSHEDELWYYLLGPGLWQVIVENYVENSMGIPEVLQEMSVTSYPVIENELNKAINAYPRNQTPN